jgi:hypothetical protein
MPCASGTIFHSSWAKLMHNLLKIYKQREIFLANMEEIEIYFIA